MKRLSGCVSGSDERQPQILPLRGAQHEGDDRRRFCAHCRLHVYNVAGMERAEANALLENDAKVCLRLYRRSDGTVITKGYSGKPMRAIRNEWTQEIETHPELLRPFPEMMLHSLERGVLHLGGDEQTDVDPQRECYPAGQAVGATSFIEP